MATFHFDDQYNTFHSRGYAAAPEGTFMVGDQDNIALHRGIPLPLACGISGQCTIAVLSYLLCTWDHQPCASISLHAGTVFQPSWVMQAAGIAQCLLLRSPASIQAWLVHVQSSNP